MSQIAIIGAGAWGTALSIVLGRKGGHRVRLWVYEKEVRESIAARRVNELFLPGQSIPDSVSPTGDLKEAIHDTEIVVAWADQFQVPLTDQPDVLTRGQPNRRRHRGDGDVDGVPTPVAVVNQMAELRSWVHTSSPLLLTDRGFASRPAPRPAP